MANGYFPLPKVTIYPIGITSHLAAHFLCPSIATVFSWPFNALNVSLHFPTLPSSVMYTYLSYS